MNKVTRREAVRILFGGLLQTTSAIVLASATTPAQATESTPGGNKSPEERANDVVADMAADDSANYSATGFFNGFHNGGWRNGGFFNGPFRNGGFFNGPFRNGGFFNGPFRNGPFLNFFF